ncbi:hypothetical protein RhiirA5_408184 [Rhizophagus irregularis]|uniref:Uncharacterized protein n=1 Tax=Rhizophagus irregularis TaxID=588596 RepID=A0A2N0Q8N7_9GLOM|nr:hypothetical protein RhiirA5_408184 [Rhizophagus irregularis]
MDIVTTGNLQKCKKCQKNLPLEAFINENTQQIKTCNICRHKATLQYKQSNQSNTEEMSKQLFERILEINTNEYLENDLTSRDYMESLSIIVKVKGF